jgi:glyoxylase-like metal-dependent hydrolase (beta-lactamase superfamily II)
LEWAYWYVEGNLQGEGRKPLEVVRENVVLFEAGDDIIPGVKTVPAYGHTPGHTGLMIESNGERLLCAVDILHRRAQFVHPEWSMSFDTDTSVSVPTRRHVLQQAADENLLMHLYHMPFPGLGHVSVEGEGFRWEPIE